MPNRDGKRAASSSITSDRRAGVNGSRRDIAFRIRSGSNTRRRFQLCTRSFFLSTVRPQQVSTRSCAGFCATVQSPTPFTTVKRQMSADHHATSRLLATGRAYTTWRIRLTSDARLPFVHSLLRQCAVRVMEQTPFLPRTVASYFTLIRGSTVVHEARRLIRLTFNFS